MKPIQDIMDNYSQGVTLGTVLTLFSWRMKEIKKII